MNYKHNMKLIINKFYLPNRHFGNAQSCHAMLKQKPKNTFLFNNLMQFLQTFNLQKKVKIIVRSFGNITCTYNMNRVFTLRNYIVLDNGTSQKILMYTQKSININNLRSNLPYTTSKILNGSINTDVITNIKTYSTMQNNCSSLEATQPSQTSDICIALNYLKLYPTIIHLHKILRSSSFCCGHANRFYGTINKNDQEIHGKSIKECTKPQPDIEQHNNEIADLVNTIGKNEDTNSMSSEYQLFHSTNEDQKQKDDKDIDSMESDSSSNALADPLTKSLLLSRRILHTLKEIPFAGRVSHTNKEKFSKMNYDYFDTPITPINMIKKPVNCGANKAPNQKEYDLQLTMENDKINQETNVDVKDSTDQSKESSISKKISINKLFLQASSFSKKNKFNNRLVSSKKNEQKPNHSLADTVPKEIQHMYSNILNAEDVKQKQLKHSKGIDQSKSANREVTKENKIERPSEPKEKPKTQSKAAPLGDNEQLYCHFIKNIATSASLKDSNLTIDYTLSLNQNSKEGSSLRVGQKKRRKDKSDDTESESGIHSMKGSFNNEGSPPPLYKDITDDALTKGDVQFIDYFKDRFQRKA